MRASSARAFFLWPFTIARGNFAPHLPCAHCMSSLVRCTIGWRLQVGLGAVYQVLETRKGHWNSAFAPVLRLTSQGFVRSFGLSYHLAILFFETIYRAQVRTTVRPVVTRLQLRNAYTRCPLYKCWWVKLWPDCLLVWYTITRSRGIRHRKWHATVPAARSSAGALMLPYRFLLCWRRTLRP